MSVYISLLHYPICDKNGRVVSTAVTNVDVHDLARLARSYSIDGYYLVTPIAEQQDLVQRIIDHWVKGAGGSYNPVRREAFFQVKVVPDFRSMVLDIESREGKRPFTVGTSAKAGGATLTFAELRSRLMQGEDRPVLLVLGTGWGLEKQFIDSLDAILEPIKGRGDYNHLSVRSAASIIVDRLLG